MKKSRNANAAGQHPRGIPDKNHVADSALSSTLVDQLIDVQRTISEALSSRRIHGGELDELFFSTIHRDAGFLIDRIAAVGMDAAAEETAGETGGEA